MEVHDAYTAIEVRRILGLTQRRLDYWDQLGLVCPKRCKKGSKIKGRGDQRIYRFGDLVRLRVLKDLRSAGLSLQKIRGALRKLRQSSPNSEPLNEILITDGKSFQRVRANGRIEDLLSDRQLVFGIVSLRNLEVDVRKRVRRLAMDKAVDTRSA